MTSQPWSLTALALVVVEEQGPHVHTENLLIALSDLCLLLQILQLLQLSPWLGRFRPRFSAPLSKRPPELRVVHIADDNEPGLPEARPGHGGEEKPKRV